MPLDRTRIPDTLFVYDPEVFELAQQIVGEIQRRVASELALINLDAYVAQPAATASDSFDVVVYITSEMDPAYSGFKHHDILSEVIEVADRPVDYVLQTFANERTVAYYASLLFDLLRRHHARFSPPDLQLHFDTSEFSDEEIAAILGQLSDLYRSIGGDALVINRTETLDPANALTPEEA